MSAHGRLTLRQRGGVVAVALVLLALGACGGGDVADPSGGDGSDPPVDAEVRDAPDVGDSADGLADSADAKGHDVPDSDLGAEPDADADADTDALGCAPGSEGYPDAAWPQPNEEGFDVTNVPPLWEYDAPGFRLGHPTLGHDGSVYITRSVIVEERCDEEDYGVVPQTLDTWLVRLSPHGEVLAEAPTAPIGACWVGGRPHRPTIRPDGVVLVMARGESPGVYNQCVFGTVTAHDPETLEVLWERHVGPVAAPLAVRADNVTLVHASAAIWALSSDGEVVWKTQMSPFPWCYSPADPPGYDATPIAFSMAVDEQSALYTPYWTAEANGEFFEIGTFVSSSFEESPLWSRHLGGQIAKLDSHGKLDWTYFFEHELEYPSSPCGASWCAPIPTRGEHVLVASEGQKIAWVTKDGSDGVVRTTQESTCPSSGHRASYFSPAIGDGKDGVHYRGRCRATYDGVFGPIPAASDPQTPPPFGVPLQGLRLANGNYLGGGVMDFGCPAGSYAGSGAVEHVLAEVKLPSYEPIRIVRPWLSHFFNQSNHQKRSILSDWLLRDDGVLILGGANGSIHWTPVAAFQTDFPPLSRCGWPRHGADNQNSFRVQTEGCATEFPEP